MNVKVILAALALMATVGTVSAQTAKTEISKEAAKTSCCADANKGKTCKMDANKTCKMGEGKGQKDGTGCSKGKCDMKGKGEGATKCANYVDANKNGTCDHKEAKK